MPRKSTPARAARNSKSTPLRPKLDPRLALVAGMTVPKLRELHDRERTALHEPAAGPAPKSARARAAAPARPRTGTAPVTWGVHFPENPAASARSRGRGVAAAMREPYVNALLLLEPGAHDLTDLGIHVRARAGDVVTASVPLSAIRVVEASPMVRFVELSRPLEVNLDGAIPYTQIAGLHTATPGIDGTGVIVGVIDSAIDFFHPDFRDAAGGTRILFIWDQGLVPVAGEAGPPALPGFTPATSSGGVEYNRAQINTELITFNPPTVPPYQTVRHHPGDAEHGTHVTGIAAGNGLGQGGTFTGAAPGSEIIFVSAQNGAATALLSDGVGTLDAFAYIFARAAALGRPCAINMSRSDNQGPHDGTSLGEQFLDNLLETPGRAISLSAGNSTLTNAHASGAVPAGGSADVVLRYAAGAQSSDDIEIWYDGHDRFDLTLTVPTTPATTIGPVAPGATVTTPLAGGVQVQVSSSLSDPRNGDNLISVIIVVPGGGSVPAGDWVFRLAGTSVINGSFHAWVDRNNRGSSAWRPPFLDATQVTLGMPSTCRRALTVGNHNKTAPTPAIAGSSGLGPSRDGRIKPEIATVGTGVTSTASRDMASNPGGPLYIAMSGTSMAAPLAAGACALLFQSRGAGLNWAQIKQLLEDTAGTAGIAVPGNVFGFGFMQMAAAVTVPLPKVDVWLRDDASDTGLEPFTGPVFWLSPDIEILDRAGNPTANPRFDPVHRFNNQIRVTVRNRGTSPARNTEVYLYWADPATNLPFPSAWNSTGIFTGDPGFVNQGNKIVVPTLAPGASVQVLFAWAPPAPGSNIRGDDHFCLLARVENEGDPSQVNTGGFTVIPDHNNLALRNVHVQPDDPGDHTLPFFVRGTLGLDRLQIARRLAAGHVIVRVPIKLLPWSDRIYLKKYGPRPDFDGRKLWSDPLAKVKVTLKGDLVRRRTGITGANLLELSGGIAQITVADGDAPLVIPQLLLRDGVSVPLALTVKQPKTNGELRYVHVAQFTEGRLVGGVSLELRRGLK